MTKVVILSTFISPFRSGAEACAEEVVLRLADRYDITIVTARMRRGMGSVEGYPSLLAGRSLGEGWEGGDVRGGVHRIRVIRVGIGFSFDKWLYPFLAPFVARRLKPDIIHGILETFAGLALHFCRWLVPGAKRILTLQTTNRSFLKKMIVRSPDQVTAISSALVKIAAGFGRRDVHVIPNGIPAAAIRKSLHENQKVPGRILFVGRLEPMKGVDTLLDAFKIVAEHHNKAHLRIVGDGSLRGVTLSSVEGSSRITLVGHVPPPDVYKEFAQAQIFCGLSRSEALGNVFLEAMAAECAVVATLVGGIPDIVQDEKTGILVPPDDPEAAAAAIEMLLTDREERERLSCAGKAFAEQFDWGAIAEKYAELYGRER